MMAYAALIPFFFSLKMVLKKDPREVFIKFFLPVLTLIPTYYQVKIVQGIPEMAFWSSALIPIVAAWVLNKKMVGYKFSYLDVVILVNLLLIFYAQYHATGYKDGQKVFFNDMMAKFFPYLLARAIFADGKQRIQMLKMICILGAIIGVFMLYESKFHDNQMDKHIRRFWPHWVPWGRSMRRWGLKRAFGPFAHPIVAGYFFAMVFPVSVWIWKRNLIPKKIGFGPGFIRKRTWGWVVMMCNFAGGFASLSRAPMISLLMSMVILTYGFAKRKVFVGGIIAFFAVSSGIFIIPKMIAYGNIDRASAVTKDQENVAYRKELAENYKEVIAERPYWGYGRNTMPVVKRQASIDNEYLWLQIAYGKVPYYAYLLFLVWVLLRLVRFVLKQPYDSAEGQLGWCFLAGWFGALFIQATVYAGTQTIQYLYMFGGMAESLVILKGVHMFEERQRLVIKKGVGHGYNFSRAL